jgi:hypothetical protein
MNKLSFQKRSIFKKYTLLNGFEFCARLWLAYILISNSGVGIITKLEDLGMPEHIYSIIKGMWDTGFMMHLVKGIELVAGLMLAFNIFVPLALVMLVPVVVNIYGIHIFLFGSFLTQGLAMLLICGVLIYNKRNSFTPLLKMK